MAGFADIDQTEDADDDSSQSTKNSKYLFGSLIFVIRDYQSGVGIGEDMRHFPNIVRSYLLYFTAQIINLLAVIYYIKEFG